MIRTHRSLRNPQRLTADVCVVGSGAGGSAAAYSLARAGRSVIVLEAGSFFTPKDFSQREERMFPRLFYDSGGRRTRNRAIRVLHGQGVGGSTLHNINLCKRAPDELVDGWGLRGFDSRTFKPFVDEVERLLGVEEIPSGLRNRSNQLLQKGVEALGYRGGPLRHNRRGCVGSGFCELGCAFDAKMNAMRVTLPEAIRAGAQVLADTRAIRFAWKSGRIEKLLAETRAPAWDGGGEDAPAVPLEIEARAFVCAGGAIETPLLLQRSEVPDPRGLVGTRLHLHPGVALAGVFAETVNAWTGIPQSFECTEFLSFREADDKRVWIIPGAAHPIGAASMLPGFGGEHRGMMELFPRLAPLSAMVHDRSSGSITLKGEFGADVDYVLEEGDRRQLALGLKECGRILLAAGASEVLLPLRRPIRVRSRAELDALELAVEDHEIDIVSVHPMGSVRMGNSPDDSCLDTAGKYHHLDNLYVADASVYPTSLGVPPQVSTYAMGLYVASRVRL